MAKKPETKAEKNKRLNELNRKTKAMKGLTLQQRKIVKEVGNPEHKTLSEVSKAAGLSQAPASRSQIYRDLKSAKLQRAIQLYYANGEKNFLADIARGTIVDVIEDETVDPSVKSPYVKLAAQISGDLKNVNVNHSITYSKDDVLQALKDLMSS